jgi:hypothetical protein
MTAAADIPTDNIVWLPRTKRGLRHLHKAMRDSRALGESVEQRATMLCYDWDGAARCNERPDIEDREYWEQRYREGDIGENSKPPQGAA